MGTAEKDAPRCPAHKTYRKLTDLYRQNPHRWKKGLNKKGGRSKLIKGKFTFQAEEATKGHLLN